MGLKDVSGSSLRHENGGGIGASLLHSVGDIGENREAEMLLTSFLGVCTTNDLGACM